ncbi:hypothetical protein L1987_20247 [Smallanthus sonchifolius]|uniref:Uncharacterized protein n=1 Tax=Smallanthus sonchifolius TaxID=185202 RepID=A0ACB9IT00_9ASTR|nr:hypothetical protein L1987_20247 [Smallanthus sonchifolius]
MYAFRGTRSFGRVFSRDKIIKKYIIWIFYLFCLPQPTTCAQELRRTSNPYHLRLPPSTPSPLSNAIKPPSTTTPSSTTPKLLSATVEDPPPQSQNHRLRHHHRIREAFFARSTYYRFYSPISVAIEVSKW